MASDQHFSLSHVFKKMLLLGQIFNQKYQGCFGHSGCEWVNMKMSSFKVIEVTLR